MAEQVTVWKSSDGLYWQTESQALAYEMKLYLMNLGKSAGTINIDSTGRIDEAGINFLAQSAVSAMTQNAAALATAVAPAQVAPVG